MNFHGCFPKMTEDIELFTSPMNGWIFKTPAKRDKIWQWIFEQAPFCEYAILSVDTLIYGNIIGSRTHHYTPGRMFPDNGSVSGQLKVKSTSAYTCFQSCRQSCRL